MIAILALLFPPMETSLLETHALSPLKLQGITYQDPTHWSFWLNNQKITPDTIPNHFLIESITPDSVTLKWRDNGTIIMLKPHNPLRT